MVQYSNGVLKTRLKKPVCGLKCGYLNVGQPSHATLPLEYRTPIVSGIHMNLEYRYKYSDGYFI